jgi:hypothetical protein
MEVRERNPTRLPSEIQNAFLSFQRIRHNRVRLGGGRDTPGQKILIEGVTSCSQCIKITVAIPKECRLNAEMLGERTKQIFQKELLRDLCRGCPFEDSEA